MTLTVAGCTFRAREANPLRSLGGSNRSRYGAVRVLSAPGCRFRGKRVTLPQPDRSRCGSAHILRTRSEPSAHFGWLKSLSLWRGAHFERAKRTLCGLWVGQIALAVARCAFWACKANPLRLGGSNRSRCGAVRVLNMRIEPLSAQSEPSARFGCSRCGAVRIWSVQKCRSQVSSTSVVEKCRLEVSFRSVDQKCRSSEVSTEECGSEVSIRSVDQKCC